MPRFRFDVDRTTKSLHEARESLRRVVHQRNLMEQKGSPHFYHRQAHPGAQGARGIQWEPQQAAKSPTGRPSRMVDPAHS